MTQKTISLNEEAYKRLKDLKRKKESYSDLILRLCTSQEKTRKEDFILKFIGVFKEDAGNWEKFSHQILKNREEHLTSEEQ